MIPIQYALRRRMIIKCDSKIEFEYTGNYTDNRDANGIGTVRFTSSGTLTVLSGKATVSAYILGAGGGGCVATYYADRRSGGGGGNQTVEVELAPGTYDIVIGAGGSPATGSRSVPTAGSGGDTTAFGVTSTGGTGANNSSTAAPGGTPNGGNGKRSYNNGYAHTGSAAGGSPNGGASNSGNTVHAGGDGYVEITFS